MKKANDDGVKSLMYAILEQAVRDYQNPVILNNSKRTPQYDKDKLKAHIKGEAKKWILSEQCLEYCEVLDIDRNKILRKLGVIQ